MASAPPPDDDTAQPPALSKNQKLTIREQNDRKKRIHILGTGSIGKFVAHALNNRPSPPPISLLFHKPSYLEDFVRPENRSMLNVTIHGSPSTTGPFDPELALPERKPDWRGTKPSANLLDRSQVEVKYSDYISNAPINHLIVTTKAHQTVKSLLPLKHRLSRDSTIVFLQNGCGTVEEVNDAVFPHVLERPNYMIGINSHGIYATGPSSAVHAGHGVIYLGILPRDDQEPPKRPRFRKLSIEDEGDEVEFVETSRYLLHSLTHLPILAAVPVPPSTLVLHQFDKLAVNCVVNPLTVLLDAPNGSILQNHQLSRTMRLLLFEISAIFRRLPEVEGIPNIDLRFSPDRLEHLVVNVAQKTSQNISSMLQDVRRGVETEIDYLNGWVVRRGESVGVKAVVNYSMVGLIKGKQNMISREVDGYMPFEGGRGRL